MSGYDDYHSEGGRERRRRSHRSRKPVYEETIVESRQGRGQPPLQQALVRRPRSDSDSSVEEIDREFDPENGTLIQRRSIARDRNGDQYGPPRPRSEGGNPRGRRDRRRRGGYDSYDSYDSRSDDSRSRSRPRKRSKSRGERALEAVGLGGAAGAIAKRVRSMSRNRARSKSRNGSRDRDDSSDSYYYSRRSSSRGPPRSGGRGRASSDSPTRRQKVEDAAKAALAAAAVEAWRSRKDVPGEAGKRIITAALASAGIDAAVQREDRHGNRNALMSAIGGLATNRLINGENPASRSRSRPGRRRDSDNAKLGTAASVAALAAIAGKAIKDQRDKSQARSKSRNRNRDDDDSDDGRRYSPSRRNRKSLSEHLYSPTDKILNKMGLGDNPDYHHPKYAKDKFGRRHYSDDEEDNQVGLRGGGGDESDSDSSCSTDSYDSDEEEKRIKSNRTKTLITGGLAAVATIHAAHSVYNSMEARESRHRKVMQGKMSPEEARRKKSRAALQDVAAVGIAALGIKGAVSEWKEVREYRNHIQNRRLRLEEMREHRQKKIDEGLWSEELRRRKREKRFGSGDGSDDDGEGQSQGGSSGGRQQQRAIGYDDGRGRGGGDDYDDDARESRSGGGGSGGRSRYSSSGRRRRARSARRYDDGYDSYDDEYYDKHFDDAGGSGSGGGDGRGRDGGAARSYSSSRRGNRSSMPPDAFGARRVATAPLSEKYASRDYPSSSSRYYADDDGPRYADGNPYAGASLRSPLSSQLPEPPLNYAAAPRY